MITRYNSGEDRNCFQNSYRLRTPALDLLKAARAPLVEISGRGQYLFRTASGRMLYRLNRLMSRLAEREKRLRSEIQAKE